VRNNKDIMVDNNEICSKTLVIKLSFF